MIMIIMKTCQKALSDDHDTLADAKKHKVTRNSTKLHEILAKNQGKVASTTDVKIFEIGESL